MPRDQDCGGGYTANEAIHLHAGQVLAEADELLVHLSCHFVCIAEDKGADLRMTTETGASYLVLNGNDVVEESHDKNGCFTHTRFGLTEKILTGKSRREGDLLNYSRWSKETGDILSEGCSKPHSVMAL